MDVGGGNGALMAEILKPYPQPTGIVYDLPRTAAAAQQTIEAADLGNRCHFVGGDAFEAVPGGGDAYVFSNSWWFGRMIGPSARCGIVVRRLPGTAQCCSSNG